MGENSKISWGRIGQFFELVFRPHPYSRPLPWIDRWTRAMVGPLEAWRLAGVFSACPQFPGEADV